MRARRKSSAKCWSVGVTGFVALCTGLAAMGVQAGPIQPDKITTSGVTLDLWLAADQLNGVGTPGTPGTVSTWTDLSGSGNHAQNTAGNNSRPTLVNNMLGPNSMPVVRFDGGTDGAGNSYVDYLQSPEFMDSDSPTMFIVGKTASSPPGATDNQIFFIDSDSPKLYVVQAFGTSNPKFRGIVRDVGGDIFGTTELGATDKYFIGVFTVDPSANPSELFRRQVYLDGSPAEQDNPTLAAYDSTICTGGDPPTFGMNAGFGGPLDGDIAEVIFYDGLLSQTDREGVEEYLYNKYFIPEPGTMTLALLAFVGAWVVGCRRRKKNGADRP